LKKQKITRDEVPAFSAGHFAVVKQGVVAVCSLLEPQLDSPCATFKKTGCICLLSRKLSTEFLALTIAEPHATRDLTPSVVELLNRATEQVKQYDRDLRLGRRQLDVKPDEKDAALAMVKGYCDNETERVSYVEQALKDIGGLDQLLSDRLYQTL
jgi:hypothetical protein